MTDDVSAPRSRRALLVAAAGGAAALAASAALPLSVAATDPDDVVKNITNPTISPTGIANTTANSNAFEAGATGTGFGLLGSSTGGAGIVGWSITSPAAPLVADTSYTGILGWSPANPSPDIAAAGVVGVSDDWGVYGDGTVGVYGYGAYGVVGESSSTGIGAAVLALAVTATDVALDVRGKVRFSRSGRVSIGAGKSTKIVYLAGTTSSSRVFALIHSNRGGRWVRAVVPAAGKFTIYLNTTVSSTTYVAWFVIN